MVKILFIGDIVGKSGRRVLTDQLPMLKQTHKPDLVIVNCENAAAGFGVTPKIADQMFAIGCDVLTSGNHIWDRKEIFDYINQQPRLIRPANFPNGTPGQGYVITQTQDGTKIAVINLMGLVFMGATLACPFRTAQALIDKIKPDADVFFIDFHAEATSEKQALVHYLDGKVAVVVGTHTHAPTADERVLPNGTAYISDVGMSGCYDSVLGMKAQISVTRFLTKLPQRLEVAEGPAELCGVLVEVDSTTGLSQSIKRINCKEAV